MASNDWRTYTRFTLNFNSRNNRHRIPRSSIIADPSSRQKEKCDQGPIPDLRVMMAPRIRTGPPSPPPPVQAPNLGAVIDRNHTVDFAIRVCVVLSLKVLLAIDCRHVDGRHGAVAGGLGGRGDSRPAVTRPVDGDIGYPTFLKADFDESGEVVVVFVSWTVVGVEVNFEGCSRSAKCGPRMNILRYSWSIYIYIYI